MKFFSSIILEWGISNCEEYPWRETTNPYIILITEILLRKTTRQQVKKIYNNFFSTYPDFRALSKATVKTIEHDIKSLGISRVRAVALNAISKIILLKYNGCVPSNYKALIELPHVGPYIANATLCFAFNLDVPILDTNIIRVITRYFTIVSKHKRQRNDPLLWKYLENLLPQGRTKDFNFALLDFSLKICRSKNPKCDVCPLKNNCNYIKTILSL